MILRELCEYVSPEQYSLNSEYKENTESPKLPNPFLSPMCEIEDKKPVSSRLSEKSDYVHVSSLLDLCPRQYALARHHNLDIKENVYPGLRIIWEMGKALEAHAIKNIKEYHGEHLVSTGDVVYNEEYKIQGAPDGIIQTGEDSYVILEVKSMKADAFKKLEQARGDHILQAAMYRWLYDEEYREDHYHENIILLYVSKDAIKGSPYKEFQINTNEPVVQNGVNIALKLAKELKDARDNNMIPARYICNREDCARARQCATANLCWSSREESYSCG
jgi:hypothetical protein